MAPTDTTPSSPATLFAPTNGAQYTTAAPSATVVAASTLDSQAFVITISTVPSIVAVVAVVAIIFYCRRQRRRRRHGIFARGVTPIDDEEIESWKTRVVNEKDTTGAALDATASQESIPSPAHAAPSRPRPSGEASPGHKKAASASSMTTIKKPPSVIVYHNPRASEDNSNNLASAASPLHSAGLHSFASKRSLDIPQTPVLARAPNSRPGLTDETVEGDAAFIVAAPVRRQTSRLSKPPPRSPRHARSRSSRSSVSVGSLHQWYCHAALGSSSPVIPGVGVGGAAAVDPVAAPPRASVDNYLYHGQSPPPAAYGSHHAYPYGRRHRRGGSISAQTPLRMSLDDDYYNPLSGMSPRPLLRREEIGKAIG